MQKLAFLVPKSMIEDNYKQRGLRGKLVRKLRQKGIREERLLEAIGKVPRHAFFDDALLGHAYEDKAFPIGEGQTISQPYTVAIADKANPLVPEGITRVSGELAAGPVFVNSSFFIL